MFKSEYSVDGTLIKNISHGSEKKVEVICDECEKEYTIIYHNYTLSQKRRNNDGLTICRKCSAVKNGRKKGQVAWNKGKYMPLEERSFKPYISCDGYRMVPNGTIDRKVKWNMYSKEHTLIMEKELGRKLEKDEVVHHRSGDKLDNYLENLKVMTRKEHKAAHISFQTICYELYKNELILFDEEKNEYYISEKLREIIG